MNSIQDSVKAIQTNWQSTPQLELRNAVVVYRAIFTIENPGPFCFAYTADERCQIYIDGQFITEGPERGMPDRWYYHDVTVDLMPGKHTLCARVLQFLHKETACGQLSVHHGFGIQGLPGAVWYWKEEKMELFHPFPDWGCYPRVKIGTDYPAGILAGKGDGWHLAEAGTQDKGRPLVKAELPPMLREQIQPKLQRPGLWQFDDYVIAYPVYHFRGEGKVKIRWSECPYDDNYYDHAWLKGHKGRRDGNIFVGCWEEFQIKESLVWPDFYWRAGRYVEVETIGDVTVEMEFFRTGYPLPEYHTDDPLKRAAYETLRNCCFETFMDCPFYEELQYIGDSRLEALCIYALGNDARLPKKALRSFVCGMQKDGGLRSHYPSRQYQRIPSYMMIWYLMLHDYWERFGNDDFMAEMKPWADAQMLFLEKHCTEGFFIPQDDSWNFIDWHADWYNGIPNGSGPCSILNFLYAMALRAYSEMYKDPLKASEAETLLDRIDQVFLNPETGLYLSFTDCREYCEHAQVLALLCNRGNPKTIAEGLRCRRMTPCSIYFSYYYLLACRQYGLEELVQKRLNRYRTLLDEGLKTLPEEFENPRSDCHAWSSHVMLF